MISSEKPTGDRPRIGVIGLGIMGSAFAKHLLRRGFDVAGYDIDIRRNEIADEMGIEVTDTAVGTARLADILLTSLPSKQALDSTATALLGDATLHDRGLVLVELSTLDVQCKQNARDRLAAVGIEMLDCPVSGTGAQADSGDIALYSSGVSDVHKQCQEVLNAFSEHVYYIGDFGQGTKMKLVANHLVAILNVAAAEAINLSESAGLDISQMLEVVGAGAAGFRLLGLRGPMMAERHYEPATMKLDVWLKDLGLIEEFASEVGAKTPLFASTVPLYTRAAAMGFAQQDTAAVRETL